MFYFTYVLMSGADNKLYVGYTSDLKIRIKEHNDGKVTSTRNRRPLELIYYEACKNKMNAILREKYFKTGFGRRFLSGRLSTSQASDGGRGREKQKLVVKKIPGGVQIKDWRK